MCHIKIKVYSSKLICTSVVVAGAGETAKRATKAKRRHKHVIWAVFIHCVQQISCCSLGLSQGEKSGQWHQLSVGHLLCALSPCRAVKDSLINLRLKYPTPRTQTRVRSVVCWATDFKSKNNLICQYEQRREHLGQVGIPRVKKWINHVQKTQWATILQKTFKVHAGRAMVCQCSDSVIFRILAQGGAAVLTGHKRSDSVAGLQNVHGDQKRKLKICGTCWRPDLPELSDP